MPKKQPKIINITASRYALYGLDSEGNLYSSQTILGSVASIWTLITPNTAPIKKIK